MPFRRVSHKIKVEAVKKCLKLENIEKVAKEYGISESTIRRAYEKILDNAEQAIPKGPIDALKKTNQTVGKIISPWAKIAVNKSEEGLTCPACGSEHVVKNGGYPALNWLLVFLVHVFPLFSIDPRRRVQRQLCGDCKSPVLSKEQDTNTMIREGMQLFRGRLICMLRYTAGMSVRDISLIIKETFGHNCSIGYISTLCQRINKRAKENLGLMSRCAKKKADMIILDETFPKTKESGTTPLGVIIDESGLIRGVKAIIARKEDLLHLLRSVYTHNFRPRYFLSDYDKTYPELVNKINPAIILCKDFVHAIRIMFRDARCAINNVQVITRGDLNKSRRAEIKKLKKSLLCKRLYKILRKLIRGFRKENASVGTLYIEGALEELKDLAERFPSLDVFYKKTSKFIHKYIDTWNLQMELNFKKGLPTTSNNIEAKNSLFKVFTKISKCFDSNSGMEEFFSSVALMENFSVKTRGKNSGTSAVMRAGVNLRELGAKDFFEAVNLTEIVLGRKKGSCVQVDPKELSYYFRMFRQAA